MVNRFITTCMPSVFLAAFMLVTLVNCQDQPELKLVNILCRHGDRAPSQSEWYPTDPYKNYTFYPMGRGGLTNEGKLRAYRLGQELKSLYGNFLGSIYEPWAIQARSSDYDRTKMTLQLLLSGLYPPAPVQKWNEDLPWQPIPTMYKRLNEDILFEPELCPKYLAELDRVRKSPETLRKSSRYSGLMEYVEIHTGRLTKTTWELYDIYHTLTAQVSANLTLPEWSAEIFPDGELLDGASLEYEIVSANDILKRLNGGMFIRKFTEDMNAYKSGSLPAGRRMFIYSGHETNIGALLMALGIYEPHVPAYTSTILVELWQLKGQYYVKVLYWAGIPTELSVKKLPGCEELCPLETFMELTKSVIPLDTDLICVKSNGGGSAATQELAQNNILAGLKDKNSL